MKNISKQLILLFLFLGISKTFANSAQPGIWNAGGKVFTMLYPEDSATFKKVQMQEERIYIQLYKGFAVVKGWYQFRNTKNETLNFKMGYPVNGIFSGGETHLNQITLDSLSSFRIFSQQKPLEILLQPNKKDFGNIKTFSNNWYTWKMNFEPKQTKEIEVFFIVSTNNASVSKGYEKNKYNGFIYLLESGSVWKNPIEKGDFYVQLMDGMNEENVHGISNHFNIKFNKNQNIFWGQKVNFSPTEKDNLIITYNERSEDFKFENILKKTDELYQTMEKFSATNFEKLEFSTFETKDPYQVDSTFLGIFPGLLMTLPFIFSIIFGIVIIVFIINFFRKKTKP